MCKGGEHYQRNCPQATTAHCDVCGYEWECEDPGPPDEPLFLRAGRCEHCGSSMVSLNRCEECPLQDLAYARRTSHAGRLLDRLLTLDFAIGKFRVGWSEVTAEEAHGLQILDQERGKKREEDGKSAEEKARARMQQAERQDAARRGGM